MWQERCNKWKKGEGGAGWGCGDDTLLLSLPPPFSACQSLGQPSEDGIEQAARRARHQRREGQGTKQSSMFLVTPQSAFQSARNRQQQRIHDIYTHYCRRVVGCQGILCQTMNGHTENILGLIMSTYCDICLGEEASQSISAPSPLCARIFGQFSFPMPISLFRPRSQSNLGLAYISPGFV